MQFILVFPSFPQVVFLTSYRTRISEEQPLLTEARTRNSHRRNFRGGDPRKEPVASKPETQGSDEKPQQIDLTKLGGTLLTSYKSKRTGDRHELWQFSVAGNDHRTIKLIHADYRETWTAYHRARDV